MVSIPHDPIPVPRATATLAPILLAIPPLVGAGVPAPGTVMLGTSRGAGASSVSSPDDSADTALGTADGARTV